MVTAINNDCLILILPTCYLFRDHKMYLSREAQELPSLYPTTTQYCPLIIYSETKRRIYNINARHGKYRPYILNVPKFVIVIYDIMVLDIFDIVNVNDILFNDICNCFSSNKPHPSATI